MSGSWDDLDSQLDPVGPTGKELKQGFLFKKYGCY